MEIIRNMYLDKIKSQLTDTQTVLFLIGARQVGKTTLLRHLLEHEYIQEDKTLFLIGDTLSYDFRDGSDFMKFITRDRDIQTIQYLIIDEAQAINNIGLILKNLIDMIRNKQFICKIIVSGSGSLNVFRGMTDSLIGRKYILHIYPCSFHEFLQTKGVQQFLPDPLFLHEYQQYFNEYLLYGGYPKVITTSDAVAKQDIFLNLLQDYLYKDVALLLKESEMMHFRRLLGILATRVGSMLSIQGLSTDTGISRYTLEKYLYVLENTFLVHTITPFFGGKHKNEIKKMNKYYLHDIGMLRYLCHVHERVGDFKGKVGENRLCNELLYRIARNQSLHFWALTSGGEVDFIIKNDFTDTISPIECKTFDDATPSRSFLGFLDSYEPRIDRVFMTTATQTHTLQRGSHTIQQTPWLYAGLAVTAP